MYGKKHLRFLSCFQVLQRKRDEDGGKGTRRETHVLCADDPIRSFPEPASPDHQTMDMLCARIDAYGIGVQRSIRAAALAEKRHATTYPCAALSLGIPVHRPQSTRPLHGAPHTDRVRVPARRGKVAFFPCRSMNAQGTSSLFTRDGTNATRERREPRPRSIGSSSDGKRARPERK